MSPDYKKVGLKISRYLLGLVFLLSGVGKLIDSSDARYLVELMATEFYWLIEYSTSIVILISIAEIVIAIFLLWGRKLKAAFSSSLILVVFFSGVLGYFYIQGQSVESCGCFGALGIGGGLEATLIRNFILFLLIAGGFVFMSSDTGRGTPKG